MRYYSHWSDSFEDCGVLCSERLDLEKDIFSHYLDQPVRSRVSCPARWIYWAELQVRGAPGQRKIPKTPGWLAQTSGTYIISSLGRSGTQLTNQPGKRHINAHVGKAHVCMYACMSGEKDRIHILFATKSGPRDMSLYVVLMPVPVPDPASGGGGRSKGCCSLRRLSLPRPADIFLEL